MSKFSTDIIPLTLPGIESVQSVIQECANEFQLTKESLSSCRGYCSYFKLNSDLPVFEGYPELFLNFIVQLRKTFGTSKTRILEEVYMDSDHFLRENSSKKF